MKALVNQIIMALRTDQMRTLREIAEGTGIQVTRVYRLKSGKLPDADELIKLAEFYNIHPDGMTGTELETAKEIAKIEATQKAYKEIYERAELKVAQKYGLTPELMNWHLTDPRIKKVV